MNQSRILFHDGVRTDEAPARYGESTYAFLNRSPWKNVERIRELLESWFAMYPSEHSDSLRSRFQDSNDSNHNAAFFELALFQILSELDCSLEIEPEGTSSKPGRPDFLATLATSEVLYVEAAVTDPITALSESPQENDALNAVNELSCPDYYLIAEQHGVLATTPPLRRLKSEFQQWIDQLDYESVVAVLSSGGQKPSHSFVHGNWTLILEALPRSRRMRGKKGVRPLQMGPSRGGFVDFSTPIKNSVITKAKKYPGLDAPFVVAINAIELGGNDRITALEALFGREQYTYEFSPGGSVEPPKLSRERNGVWFGKSGSRYTRVSGVLIFDNLAPWSLRSASTCLYMNPWAAFPIPKVLCRFPHAVPDGERMEFMDGESVGDILGIPPNWPGPK